MGKREPSRDGQITLKFIKHIDPQISKLLALHLRGYLPGTVRVLYKNLQWERCMSKNVQIGQNVFGIRSSCQSGLSHPHTTIIIVLTVKDMPSQEAPYI